MSMSPHLQLYPFFCEIHVKIILEPNKNSALTLFSYSRIIYLKFVTVFFLISILNHHSLLLKTNIFFLLISL